MKILRPKDATELANKTFSPLPNKKYSIVYADCPWEFQTYSPKGHGKSAQRHYQCVPTRTLCTLPVRDITTENCVLFLWATWPMIFDAKKVIEAWGFKYSGLAWEWIKKNPDTGKYAFGGGYGTRKNLEPLLLARKGSPQILRRDVRDFLYAPRREHSRKPDECYPLIESMYAGKAIELFSRSGRKGWDSWGNEVGKFK